MDSPLGRAVGNSLEVIESLETLKGRRPQGSSKRLSVALAARMVHMGGQTATLAQAEAKVEAALVSGRGLEKFRAIIVEQGGDARVVDDYENLPTAPHRMLVRAQRSGYVTSLDAELLGRATMVLAHGRNRVEDSVDHGVGALVLRTCGEAVKAGEPLVELHYGDTTRLNAALELAAKAYEIGDVPGDISPTDFGNGGLKDN